VPPQPPADFASTGGPAAVTATGTNGAYGISASSDNGTGVSGIATSATGVFGGSISGTGVNATSETGLGLFASSGGEFAVQVFAPGSNLNDTPPGSPAAIFADGGPGYGVVATSYASAAVSAKSDSGIALAATSTTGPGIVASAGGGAPGVNVTTDAGIGVEARSNTGTAVYGSTVTSTGVAGITDTGIGVSANGGSAGVALQVIGKVQIQGNSAGTTILHHGTNTVTVSNPAATTSSLIFLTPQEDPQGFLWISAHTAGSFTIKASTAPSANVTIGFLIIN
jgi:hypothetical protein